MFRRLKLGVTWGPINNSSSDISLFLFNLYLQQSNIYVLEFLSLCISAGYCTPKWHKKEKKRELHLIYHLSTQIPPSFIIRLLKRPVLRAQSQWLPQPIPCHHCLPWRPESKIPELHPVENGTRKRIISRGNGIPIISGGRWKTTPSTFGTFWFGLKFSPAYISITTIWMTSVILVVSLF